MFLLFHSMFSVALSSLELLCSRGDSADLLLVGGVSNTNLSSLLLEPDR